MCIYIVEGQGGIDVKRFLAHNSRASRPRMTSLVCVRFGRVAMVTTVLRMRHFPSEVLLLPSPPYLVACSRYASASI